MKSWLKILLLLLTVLLIAALVWGVRFVTRIQNPALVFAAPAPDHTPLPTPAAVSATAAPAPTPTPTQDPEAYLGGMADVDFMQNRVNILGLGIDESAERAHWGAYRTDTMMLISVDFAKSEVTLISIPRDCYVTLYTGTGEPVAGAATRMDKINNAFVRGGGAQKSGYAYSCMTVSKLLDVPVSHYVCVNIPVVKDVVDAMGGLWYDMDVEFTMNGRAYTPGYQHMDGQAVMDYCRLRHGSSDLERVDRQQRILAALLETLKDTGKIGDLPEIYTAVQNHVDTDLTFEQISALALFAYRMDMSSLQRYTVPTAPVIIGGKSCLAVKNAQLEKIIKTVFDRGSVDLDPAQDAAVLLKTVAALTTSSGAPGQGAAGQTVNWYTSGGAFYVQFPGSEEYVQVSAEEFYALTR